MVAQAVSAIVQISSATSPLQFGVTPAQANQIGLTISTGLTPMFWVFCAFLATLIMLCVWLVLAQESPAQAAAWPHHVGPYSAAPAAAPGPPADGVTGAAAGMPADPVQTPPMPRDFRQAVNELDEKRFQLLYGRSNRPRSRHY